MIDQPLRLPARYSVGVDPGWRNAGIAIVKAEVGECDSLRLVHSQTIDPKELGGHIKAANKAMEIVGQSILNDAIEEVGKTGEEGEFDSRIYDVFIVDVAIERYVSYNGVNTAEAENILLFIGALMYAFSLNHGVKDITLHRAIDWKSNLVKLLVKNRGFDNPSQSLDKKFSIAAAHACLDIKGEFSNDHEADAVCLASLGFLEARYAKVKKIG